MDPCTDSSGKHGLTLKMDPCGYYYIFSHELLDLPNVYISIKKRLFKFSVTLGAYNYLLVRLS